MTVRELGREIRVAVVGYGGAFNMGASHLNQMKEVGMIPVAACDADATRLNVARTDFPNIQTFTSVAAMLKKSDAQLVTIITPHNTHARLALQCLRAGRHVVCEKPFAITTAECDAMIAEAKRRKLMLSTYHNRHWDGCALDGVREIVKNKVIGDVVRINIAAGNYGKPGDWWRTSRTISGGILYDWGVHFLEYALQIMRADMVEVTGYSHSGHWAPQTPWKNDTNEDDAFVAVRFRNEKWLTLSMSHIESRAHQGFMTVTGTRGAYVMDHNGYEIITHPDGATLTTRRRGSDSEGWRFYRNIKDHLTRGTPLVITPEWARRPIHILDLAGQSAKLGRALKTRYA